MGTFDGNGLVIDRLDDIKTEMQNEFIAVFGNGINLADTSPLGVLIGIMSERYYNLWEKLEAVYIASFPDLSYGKYLDELCVFNGVTREPATYSGVQLQFTRSNLIGDGDVVIPAGTQATADDSSITWTTQAEATILNGTMAIETLAVPDVIGAIGAVAESITNLTSTPANVDSVTNLLGAEIGSAEESDAALKIRRDTELGRVGTATQTGIRSAIQALDEVTKAVVLLNDSDYYIGLQPPHSVACYADSSSIGDQATKDLIAQSIWDSKGAGINTYGDLSGTAVDDNGDDQTVLFNDITTKYIDVEVTLTTNSNYDSGSEEAIKQALEDYSLTLVAGQDVLNYKLQCAVTGVGAEGVEYISVATRFTPPPTVSFDGLNREILANEVGFIDTDSVTFAYV